MTVHRWPVPMGDWQAAILLPDVLELCERCYGLDDPGTYFRHGSFVSDYGSQIFEALNGFQLLTTDPDVTADAIGVVGHQFGLLCTDLHAICCRSLVKVLHLFPSKAISFSTIYSRIRVKTDQERLTISSCTHMQTVFERFRQ